MGRLLLIKERTWCHECNYMVIGAHLVTLSTIYSMCLTVVDLILIFPKIVLFFASFFRQKLFFCSQMEVLSQRSLCSTLNPNAPLFVPLAYQMVEDFSDEWWALVQSSPCFRHYWLQERFHDPQNDDIDEDDDDDLDDVFDDYDDFFFGHRQEEKEGDYEKEMVPIGALKWRKGRVMAESPRFVEKAPKIVSVKVSPRNIHQPR
ncbi:hypothetical protein PTKIN_Ptkin16aG0545900 [Pterospermum kingtungense]